MRSAGRIFGLRDLLRRLRAPEVPVRKLPANGALHCTVCGYCMPCPYGVDIPVVFSLCASVSSGEKTDWRKFLEEYWRAVPYLRQANHCIGCGICVSQCPQSIDIPDEMRRIDEFVESLKERALSS